MSATNQRFITHQLKSIPLPVLAASLTDANKVWQATVQQLNPKARSLMVLRCEELPLVLINEDVLGEAFCSLLYLLMKEQGIDAKLYLLINSSTPPFEDLDLALPIGYRRSFIQFQTNISFSEAKVKAHQSEIEKLKRLINPFGGEFSIMQLKNSGSVFVISLPGK